MKRLWWIAVVALVVAGCGTVEQAAESGALELSSASASNFVAPLSGGEEVPPSGSAGRGVATFQLSPDGTELTYRLIVANIENVRASHIHLAAAGENGPVVALLFGGPKTEGRTQGVLAEGTITAADLLGPLTGASLDALVAAMRSGDTYVNVHTDQFPGGEIRGQIR